MNSLKFQFVINFIQTAIILTLASADLSEQPYIGWTFTQGNAGDFDGQFFVTTGNVITTTITLKIILPPIMMLQKVLMRSVKIWRDRGYTCKKVNRTRKTSIK